MDIEFTILDVMVEGRAWMEVDIVVDKFIVGFLDTFGNEVEAKGAEIFMAKIAV
jgi:hypothetical protein